jgi:hypothetical protein
MRNSFCLAPFVLAWVACLLPTWQAVAKNPTDKESLRHIDSRLQLFVDDWLIDRTDGVSLELQTPIDAGKALDLTLAWEGPLSGIPCAFRDGDKYRMYYRGARREMQSRGPLSSNICYAESTDGVHWTKPNLGLYEFAGSKQNNITYIGDGTPQWFCFKDDNPAEPAERRYKAICGLTLSYGGPWGVLTSPDGFHWQWWKKEPILVGGPLDTQNTVGWYPERGLYMAYLRNWVDSKVGFESPPEVDAPPSEYNTWYWPQKKRVRSIMTTSSRDFVNWSRPQWLVYDKDTPLEHLYTNGITTYFRAPHIQLGFAERFVPDRVALEDWVGSKEARGRGLDDVLFMSSRDGLHWDRRFKEAFIRPGPDRRNWVDHGNMAVAPAVLQTGPGEMSLYYVAHYQWDDTIHIRRCRLRLDGFVAVHAGYEPGELVTKPLEFSGKELVLNFATSAAGTVRVEIQDTAGNPIPGFTLADCPDIFGDQLERPVTWKSGSDVSSLAGKPVRLRFFLQDADLYSLRFR